MLALCHIVVRILLTQPHQGMHTEQHQVSAFVSSTLAKRGPYSYGGTSETSCIVSACAAHESCYWACVGKADILSRVPFKERTIKSIWQGQRVILTVIRSEAEALQALMCAKEVRY